MCTRTISMGTRFYYNHGMEVFRLCNKLDCNFWENQNFDKPDAVKFWTLQKSDFQIKKAAFYIIQGDCNRLWSIYFKVLTLKV